MEKNGAIIRPVDNLESYVDAKLALDQYHDLNKKGFDYLDDLLFEYARAGIANKYLKYAFETHLISCDYCLDELKFKKLMFEMIDEYGEEAAAIVKSRGLVKLADEQLAKGDIKSTIDSLTDALGWMPGTQEIRDRIEALENQLVSKTFNVIVDGEEKVVKWVGEYIEKIYHATKNIVVKFSGQELVRMERIPSFGFQDKDEGSYSYEGDDFTVEIRKGMYEDLLIIRPKRSGK
jgi:hypothetical protein